MTTQWEYTVLESPNHKSLMQHANDLGADGWEMTGTDQAHGWWLAFFKRERTGNAEHVVSRIGDGVLELVGGLNVPEG